MWRAHLRRIKMNPSPCASPELTALEPNSRVLVIDDNRLIHEDFQKILAPALNEQLAAAEAALFPELGGTPKRRIFEIERAFQGLDGIERMRRAMEEGRPPAVAFLDIRMPPGIDGVDTALRLLELSDELQIVLCTAHSDYSWEDLVERLGYTDRVLLLKKPFCAIEVLQIASALSAKWSFGRGARRTLDEINRIVEERTEALRVANEKLHAEIEQRQAAQEQMLRAQRLECVGALASGIAHDLNNLLSPISMGADLLHFAHLAPRDAHLVETMQSATARAAQLVSRMLTFARGREDERTLVDVAGVVREVARLAKETFPPRIQISQDLPAGLRLLHGHPTQLHQLLMNLCVNARDAMPEGGELTIAADNFDVDESFAAMVREAKPGAYLVLRVADTGTGIPPEIRDKIFDPFFSTKAPDKGTGLGLSTIAGIVRDHGGFLRVESTVGRGTSFAIHLPAAVEGALAQGGGSGPAAAAGAGRDHHGGRRRRGHPGSDRRHAGNARLPHARRSRRRGGVATPRPASRRGESRGDRPPDAVRGWLGAHPRGAAARARRARHLRHGGDGSSRGEAGCAQGDASAGEAVRLAAAAAGRAWCAAVVTRSGRVGGGAEAVT